MLTFLHHLHRCSMPNEQAELLPCGRTGDRCHSQKGRLRYGRHLPEKQPEQTRGSVMISSTIPSAKFSCSGSPLMFWERKHGDGGLIGECEGFTINERRSLSQR